MPEELEPLVQKIDEAYESFEADREMLERSLEISSQELMAAATDIRASEELLRRTLEATEEGVMAIDGAGKVLHVNRRYFEILELPSDHFETVEPQERLAAIARRLIDPTAFTERSLAIFREQEASETFDVLYLKSGRIVERHSRALNRREGGAGRVLSYRDVTERHTLTEQLKHQAFHDPLTDLANRARFQDRLDHAIERSQRTKALVFVLFIDIDNFKSINDSLGHAVGDQLIVTIAGRVSQALSGGDTAARLGGDEFAIILEDLQTLDQARGTADELLNRIRAPAEIDGNEVVVTASIGIASGDSESTSDKLIRNADIAMYAAKNRGKGRVQVYETGMHTQINQRQALLAELWHAVERKEIRVYYQPFMHLATGQVSGAEALARWHHPTRGIIPPLTFIPLAEESSVILDIGEFVLRDACLLIKDWERRFPGEALLTSVNVSPKQIHDRNFVDVVRRVLAETQAPPGHLVLEITESAMLEDPESAEATLTALKQLGVKLALDDFGTGYSSLTYLKRFPIDVLKIDKSFITDLHVSEREAALTGATIALGQKLNLQIVAEGIETTGQLQHLRDLDCDEGQGFLFSHPLTHEELDSFMDANMRVDTADAA
ncbi:MAG TPA: EAL domain-containing protein [Dehalococcoidia bacterium]|nr:EAL domain-containing protein [Dehalococcoidia bacterium]